MDGRLKIPNPIKSRFQSSDSLKGLELSSDPKISMGVHGVSGRVNEGVFLHIGTVGTVPQDVSHHQFSEIGDHQPIFLKLESWEGAIRLPKCVYQ